MSIELESTSKVRLNRTIRFYRLFLKAGLTIVSIAFVNSLLRGIEYPSFESLNASLILRLTLVGYLYLWFAGCNKDLSVQHDVFRDGPGWRMDDTLVALLVAIGFVALFMIKNIQLLSILFLSFLFLNVMGWLYLRKRVKPFLQHAIKKYKTEHDSMALVRSIIYREYMFGKWQWWRFCVGSVLLVFLAAIAFGANAMALQIDASLLFSLTFAITILILEAWIWYRRAVLKTQWDGLEWLKNKGYLVVPKSQIKSNLEQS